MRTDTRDKIIEYIRTKQHVRAHDIIRFLAFSPSSVHRQLKRLVGENVLKKSGLPPLVFYSLGQVIQPQKDSYIPAEYTSEIASQFLYITPEGKLLYGVEGFITWASIYQPKKDILLLAQEYISLITTTKTSTPKGWFEATEKMHDTFKESAVDRLLFADVYSYPLFGRTKLAKLVMHAKQSENKSIISSITNTVVPIIEHIIKEFRIEAVAFIPPTIPRPVQFMDEFARGLHISLPRINLAKIIPGDIPIAQKSLSQLSERVVNAQSSIFPKNSDAIAYSRILLIDDVVGSGASFAETAKKLKAVGIGKKLTIAFAIVGNKKGYEVIRAL